MSSAVLIGMRDCVNTASPRGNTVYMSMNSVILIGMPGCGKTVVGRALAEATGREFFDTDEYIERETGLSIPALFEKIGERGFRELETAALARAAESNGIVIATGGGAVCTIANKAIIQRAGVAVYLTRALELLEIAGRPLSGAMGVREIYARRARLYESWADARADNNSTIARVAQIVQDIWLHNLTFTH